VSNAPSKPVSFSRPKVGYFSNRPRIWSGQNSNILSTCCSTGEFLLDFLEVIILANLFLSSFTDCHETRCMMSC